MVQSSGTVQASTWGVVQANPLVSLHRQIGVGYPFVSAIFNLADEDGNNAVPPAFEVGLRGQS